MAVAFRTAGAVSIGNDASVETAAPSGVVSGDLLILSINVELGGNITAPTGWTAVRAVQTYWYSTGELYTYWRIADGTSADTPTVTLSSAATSWTSSILRFDGHDATTPIDTSIGLEDAASPMSFTTQTVASDGSMALHIAAGYLNETGTWSATNSFTLRAENASGEEAFAVFTKAVDSGDNTASDVTNTSTLLRSGLVGIIIAPSAGGGGITGTISQTESSDTSSASGGITYSGTIAQTEENDASSAVGSAGDTISGTISITENNDSWVSSGSIEFAGSLNQTEEIDASSAYGYLEYAGGIAQTEINDGLSASGVVGDAINGVVSSVEQFDINVGVGAVIYIGQISTNEQSDTCVSGGNVETENDGTMSVIEQDDSITATNIEWVAITGRYNIDGVQRLITNRDELLTIIEEQTTRADARVAMSAYFDANGIDARLYKFNASELLALQRLR